jgi:hypothetical protein
MRLVNRFPGQVNFRLYNTGGMGEVIEEYDERGVAKKRLVRKAERVPLELMAAVQRGDLRGTNKYEKGVLGTMSIVEADGRRMDEWDVHKLYTQEQIDHLSRTSSAAAAPSSRKSRKKDYGPKSSQRPNAPSAPWATPACGGAAHRQHPPVATTSPPRPSPASSYAATSPCRAPASRESGAGGNALTPFPLSAGGIPPGPVGRGGEDFSRVYRPCRDTSGNPLPVGTMKRKSYRKILTTKTPLPTGPGGMPPAERGGCFSNV